MPSSRRHRPASMGTATPRTNATSAGFATPRSPAPAAKIVTHSQRVRASRGTTILSPTASSAAGARTPTSARSSGRQAARAPLASPPSPYPLGRGGLPQMTVDDTELIDIDGDGLIDEREYFMQKNRLDDVEYVDYDGDGVISQEEKLMARAERGRVLLLKDFAERNRKHMWAFGQEFSTVKPDKAVEALQRRCKEVYKGNLALMLRDLENKEFNVKLQQSLQMRGNLQPTVRHDPPLTYLNYTTSNEEGAEQPSLGYFTARQQRADLIERTYLRTQRTWARETAPQIFRRTKGLDDTPVCLPGFQGRQNCAGWAHSISPEGAEGVPCYVRGHCFAPSTAF